MAIQLDLTQHVLLAQSNFNFSGISQNNNHFRLIPLFFLVNLILIILTPLFAKSSRYNLRTTVESVNESMELASRTIANTYDRHSIYNRYDVMGINRVLDLGVGIQYTRTDYSKFYIRDNTTAIVPLEQQSKAKNESSADANIGYQKGSWGYIFTTGQPINQTYFKQHSYQAGISKSFFRKSTQLSFFASRVEFIRPLTYYRDPITFEIKPQPTKISTDSFTLDWDQIINEKVKTKNGFGYSKENAERPSNVMAYTKWAASLSSRVFYKLHYKYIHELTSNDLKNDRGYFKNHLFNNELSWEFVYDWVVSVAYTLVREDEHDSRTQAKRRTGVDQYGISLDYNLSKTMLSLSYSQLETNSGVKSNQINLGATWNF